MLIKLLILAVLSYNKYQNPLEIINQGIASKEETILPGLGILFEQYYNSLNSSQQTEIIKSLCNLLKCMYYLE